MGRQSREASEQRFWESQSVHRKRVALYRQKGVHHPGPPRLPSRGQPLVRDHTTYIPRNGDGNRMAAVVPSLAGCGRRLPEAGRGGWKKELPPVPDNPTSAAGGGGSTTSIGAAAGVAILCSSATRKQRNGPPGCHPRCPPSHVLLPPQLERR